MSDIPTQIFVTHSQTATAGELDAVSHLQEIARLQESLFDDVRHIGWNRRCDSGDDYETKLDSLRERIRSLYPSDIRDTAISRIADHYLRQDATILFHADYSSDKELINGIREQVFDGNIDILPCGGTTEALLSRLQKNVIKSEINNNLANYIIVEADSSAKDLQESKSYSVGQRNIRHLKVSPEMLMTTVLELTKENHLQPAALSY